MVAMVADFGLSRDIYKEGQYENTAGVYLVYYVLIVTIDNNQSIYQPIN